jgi:hypothetical protein
MDDLASPRVTCSDMHSVCRTAKVGRRIPLHRLLQRQGFWERYYYDDDNYRTLLTARLANMGNLDTCFLVGLRPVFVEGHRSLTPLIEMASALYQGRFNTGAGNDDIARCLLRSSKVLTKLGRLHCCGRTRPVRNAAKTCTGGCRTWCHNMWSPFFALFFPGTGISAQASTVACLSDLKNGTCGLGSSARSVGSHGSAISYSHQCGRLILN